MIITKIKLRTIIPLIQIKTNQYNNSFKTFEKNVNINNFNTITKISYFLNKAKMINNFNA